MKFIKSALFINKITSGLSTTQMLQMLIGKSERIQAIGASTPSGCWYCLFVCLLSSHLFWTSDYTFRYNMWTSGCCYCLFVYCLPSICSRRQTTPFRIICGRQPRSHRRQTTQQEFFFLHLPSVVLSLFFFARRIQPSLSLVDREVELCVEPAT